MQSAAALGAPSNAMNKPMRREHSFKTSKRLAKKTAVFQILGEKPDLSAVQLQQRAAEAGLPLTLISAYRAIKAFKLSGGRLEVAEGRCLRTVAAILQDAEEAEHLSVEEIHERAAQRDVRVHQSTVYRVLNTLTMLGMVRTLDKGRQKFYEWKRDDTHHGHLTCIMCGKTLEFQENIVEQVAAQVCDRLGYDFDRIEYVVRSLCDACR